MKKCSENSFFRVLSFQINFTNWLAKNEEMYLFSPYSIEREYGVPFAYIDITEKYDELVANPRLTKQRLKLVI